jgi:hypothetical protein
MAKRGPYITRAQISEIESVPFPLDPDEKYILEAIVEVENGQSIGSAAHLIPKVHFRDDSEEHRIERERLRSKLRRVLPERLIRKNRP